MTDRLNVWSGRDGADYRPLMADEVPTTHASEAAVEGDAADALAYLTRVGAVDLAPMLGLVS